MKVYFHSFAEPVKGQPLAVFAWVAALPDGTRLAQNSGVLGTGPEWNGHTAMYAALSNAAQLFISTNTQDLEFVTCSKLVAGQVSGDWNCEAPSLIRPRKIARAIIRFLGSKVEYGPKAENPAVKLALETLQKARAA